MSNATDQVNEIARSLQAKLAEGGYTISAHEAQALSVVGLMAAAEVNTGKELDAELQDQGRALVARILDEGKT